MDIIVTDRHFLHSLIFIDMAEIDPYYKVEHHKSWLQPCSQMIYLDESVR